MNYESIAEIYAANDKIWSRLQETVAGLSAAETEFLPAGENWTIAALVEHVAIVEEGMTKITAKLLAQSEDKTADGTAKMSANFLAKAAEIRHKKLEAPDRVRPTGTQTIAESLARLEANRRQLASMRTLFESIECSDYKFPHPYIGELTAHEWLALIGGHQARHLQQIKKILAQARESI